MPKKGTKECTGKTVKMMMHEGKPQKQSVAIAMQHCGKPAKSGKKK